MLFKNGGSEVDDPNQEDVITFEGLKRVAELIEEDISDEEIREMIEEASKESSKDAKISMNEFREVLNRAINS